MTEEKIQNPGSDEALEQGCKCPVLDNALEGQFIMLLDCPLHGEE